MTREAVLMAAVVVAALAVAGCGGGTDDREAADPDAGQTVAEVGPSPVAPHVCAVVRETLDDCPAALPECARCAECPVGDRVLLGGEHYCRAAGMILPCFDAFLCVE